MELTQKILIADVIDNLEEREKNILDMYYWCGYKEREIAKYHNISQPRINQIKNRALGRCKKLMNEKQYCAVDA